MKNFILKNKKIIHIVVIIIISCILCCKLFKSNLDVYCDDGIQHIARAYGTFQSIKENGFFSKVIFQYTNNFGYSWDLFYGPFSTWGIILLNFVFNNYIIAYKSLALISLILSGIFMYKFVKSVTLNDNAALLAAILYISFPYHLTDLYTRNALGEYMSFIFIPMVFLGLYNIFYTEENPYYLAAGAIGLICTHNISCLMVIIFAGSYCISNIKKLKETKVKKKMLLNIICIILITSFFWAPMIETKMKTQYHVYENGAMSTSDNMAKHGLILNQLFVSKIDGAYTFELGLQNIIMLGLSIMAFRIIDDKYKKNYDFFLISTVITLWLTTKYFPWKLLPDWCSIMQYPWRFMEMLAFFVSIVCSINMLTIIKNFNWKDVIVISLIAITYTFSLLGMAKYEDNIKEIAQIDKGKVTGRNIEVVAGMGKAEYLPENAYKNRFYIATREDAMYVLKGKAIIENEQKNSGKYTAQIKTLDAEYTIFELPYIYYPGYVVTTDGVKIDTFETDNGFLGFALGKNDEVKLEVKYEGSTITKISMLISLVSLVGFTVYVFKKYY